MSVLKSVILTRVETELNDASNNVWGETELNQYITDEMLALSPWLGVETMDTSLTTSTSTTEYDVSSFDPVIETLLEVQIDISGDGDYTRLEGTKLFNDTIIAENRFSTAGRTLRVFYLGAFENDDGTLNIPSRAENLLVTAVKKKAYEKLLSDRAHQELDDSDLRPSEIIVMIKQLSEEVERMKSDTANPRNP